MQNSKLINVISTFSTKEIRRFDEYLNSSYFNKNELVAKLYEFCRADYPKFRPSKTDRRDAFSYVFPNETFSEQKLRYVMTDLVKLLEDYLSLTQYEKKPIRQKQNLLRELSERNLNKYFQSSLDIAQSMRSKNTYRDAAYFYDQYALESESYIFQVRNFQRNNDESLQNSVENLDLFYLATKLRSCCELMNRKNVFADDYQILFLDEILVHLKNNEYNDFPAISIYYQILMTLVESDDESHFSLLKDLLNDNADKFSMDEARDMYAFAQNYCIKKINGGNTSYLNELFLMYKTLIEKEIIFLDNFLSPWHFKNIVYVSLRLHEVDWTESFIYEYKNKISPEYRDNAFTYNLASLHFHKKEYSKALKLLQNVDYTDNIYYHLDSKSLLLKTYFELEEVESLLSLIDAFRIFLRRNKLISDYQRSVYLNLVKFVKKALNIKLKSKSHEKIMQLREEIEKTKKVADLKWLLTKIDEMDKLAAA
ncbi:MAG: hypothetical protein COC01_03510 [Bacteroidetes bacterium]|nr:hypothetical protein [Bacteroidia bacterium]PCH68570.1 MAG: hypothetical protein COC01_03510 [Bacteroidota bacterium]